MKNINPSKTKAWKKLQEHFDIIKKIKLTDLFEKDADRFSAFSSIFEDQILVDFSKNHITSETISKLEDLAKECDLASSIQAMFNGKKINRTEHREALHIALRNCRNMPIFVDGKDVMPKVNAVLNKIERFCNCVIRGEWRGYTNKAITDVVNIGVGGSDMGPYMVTEALRPYKNHLIMHFISNLDGTHIFETLKNLNPETTLFLISSKTFSTQETITNANSARNWFLDIAHNKKNIEKHFIALSANITSAIEFGINRNNIFEFWDWVGGRYSLWSSIGLSIALSLGFKNFKKLLNGAYSMDQHFLRTPFKKNLPVMLALISIWYSNFFRTDTEALLPYDQYLHRFPAYFQQGNMESNGKSVDRNGDSIDYQTGSIIWGEPGTNGQHAFYQLIHQGTKIIPCDFIAPAKSHNSISDHHEKLLSHFFAQTEALAFGRSRQTVEKEISISGKKIDQLKHIVPFMVFEGNRPSNSILIRKINPYNLGALIALYEHKIFTQGIILNIYTFDQWGVELGKTLAKNILKELKGTQEIKSHDSSTNGLINYYKSWR